MTEDIVERLSRIQNYDATIDLFVAVKDAAEEIKRLRAASKQIADEPPMASEADIDALTQRIANCLMGGNFESSELAAQAAAETVIDIITSSFRLCPSEGLGKMK